MKETTIDVDIKVKLSSGKVIDITLKEAEELQQILQNTFHKEKIITIEKHVPSSPPYIYPWVPPVTFQPHTTPVTKPSTYPDVQWSKPYSTTGYISHDPMATASVTHPS